MSNVPVAIDPEAIRAAARAAGARHLGTGRVASRAATASTQDDLLALAEQGEPEGTVAIADVQQAGRGRRGREWCSPAGGGLWFSVLLRPDAEALTQAPISLMAGLAVAEALEDLCGVSARLKWPNDVLVGGQKLAGILGESRETPDGQHLVAIGIGINVTLGPDDLPDDLAASATSVSAATDQPPDRVALLGAVLAHLETRYTQTCDPEQRPALLKAVGQRLDTIGQRVRVTLEGREPMEGEAVGLTARGELVIRDTLDNEHEILAGDVEHLREQ